jgi:hypothetical protein
VLRRSLLPSLLLAPLASASPPASCTADGDLDYYRCRAADFSRRNPDLAPPDYYLEYGDVYVRRFTDETRPLLSPDGQAWLDGTRTRLQRAMESRRAADPVGYAQLERDPTAFRTFAFETHPPAYETGLAGLPLRDLVLIVTTPDVQDVLGVDGAAQVTRVIRGLGDACREQGLGACSVERLLIEARERRRLWRDRWGLRPTFRVTRFLARRIAGSVLRALGPQEREADEGITAALDE